MATDSPMKARRAWVAGLLAAVCPGLGHLYAGRPVEAILIEVVPPLLGTVLFTAGALIPGALFPCLMVGLGLYAVIWILQAAWAVVIARQAGETYRLARYNRFLVYLGFYVGSTIASNVLVRPLRQWVMEPYKISAGSMSPTLMDGDHVFVVKIGPEARWTRGDVVTHLLPGYARTVFLHRVVATGGDLVEVRDRQVAVNGGPLELGPCEVPGRAAAPCFAERTSEGKAYQVMFQPERDGGRIPFGPMKLEPDQFVVLGDNRDNSLDSRSLGAIQRSAVGGRAVIIWFSFSMADGIRWSRMGRRL